MGGKCQISVEDTSKLNPPNAKSTYNDTKHRLRSGQCQAVQIILGQIGMQSCPDLKTGKAPYNK